MILNVYAYPAPSRIFVVAHPRIATRLWDQEYEEEDWTTDQLFSWYPWHHLDGLYERAWAERLRR